MPPKYSPPHTSVQNPYRYLPGQPASVHMSLPSPYAPKIPPHSPYSSHCAPVGASVHAPRRVDDIEAVLCPSPMRLPPTDSLAPPPASPLIFRRGDSLVEVISHPYQLQHPHESRVYQAGLFHDTHAGAQRLAAPPASAYPLTVAQLFNIA